MNSTSATASDPSDPETDPLLYRQCLEPGGLRPSARKTLAAGGYLDAGDPIVLLGDSGSGKTHLLIGLGIAACEQARRVRYATCAQLVNELVEAADERRHTTPGFDRRAKNCDVAAPRSAARLDLDPSWFHASSHLTTNGSWLSTTAARTSATARRAHDKS